MEWICSDCHIKKPESEFVWKRSGGYTRKPQGLKHTCIDCREKRRKIVTEGLRRCSICESIKPRSEFSPTTQNTLSTRCKECSRNASEKLRQKAFASATHFTCNRCKQEKPRDQFMLSVVAKRGEKRCLQCLAERAAEGRNTEWGKFLAAKAIARRRGVEWTITREEYASLRSQMCHYCGFDLPKSGLALDRKDCNIGYILDNVVPCCWECNCAKGSSLTYEEMLIIGEAMSLVKYARKERGEDRPSHLKGWGRSRKYAAE